MKHPFAHLPILAVYLSVLTFLVSTYASFAAHRTVKQKTIHAPQMAASGQMQAQLDFARRKVYPCLVNIAVVARLFDGGRAERSPAGGSGVIISPDGYVLTNFHVAGHTTRITCSTSDGVTYNANVVGHDSLADISVLKLQVPRGSGPLPYATLGDSDKLQVGDFVLAMGNPLLLSSSMTLGIVSNAKRVFTDFTGTQIQSMNLETGEVSGTFTRWIQHDALILPGNSGGPLVNLNGEVIGINELGGNGLGFAIPSNIAKSVFEQIKKYGEVKRGWLGVTVLPVQKLGRSTGALIASVTPNSPSDDAGIKPGSILLSVNNQAVNVRFFEQVPLFYQRVAQFPAGTNLDLKLLYQGAIYNKTVTLQNMPHDLGEEEDFPAAGITVRAITMPMAQEEFLPSTNGVEVTGVRPGYAFESAQPALREGDVITSLGDIRITTLKSFKAALIAKTKASGPDDDTLVGFRRNDEELLSTIKLNKSEPDTGGGELPQAWLGIKTQVMVPDLASALGEPDLKGFRVTEVYPFTEAYKSGIEVNDVITAVGDTILDASKPQDADDLHQAIQAMNIGDIAKLRINRNGHPITISAKLEPSPESAADEKTLTQKELEFTVRNINDIDRFSHHWAPNQTGVLVTDTPSGGYANIAGLHSDDLIVEIDGAPVNRIKDIRAIMSKALKRKPVSIEFFVRRDASTQFVFIEPDWSKLTVLTEE